LVLTPHALADGYAQVRRVLHRADEIGRDVVHEQHSFWIPWELFRNLEPTLIYHADKLGDTVPVLLP
jgi:hypothetical protein